MKMECIYFSDCRVKKRPICLGTYARCITYRRRQVLNGRSHKQNKCLETVKMIGSPGKHNLPYVDEWWIGSRK